MRLGIQRQWPVERKGTYPLRKGMEEVLDTDGVQLVTPTTAMISALPKYLMVHDTQAFQLLVLIGGQY
jgi:hypothetical protein